MFLPHLVEQLARRARAFAPAIFALASIVLPARAAHADTFINFEGYADNTTIDSQFVGSGVLFDGVTGIPGRGAHISAGDVTAHSGVNVLINDPIANEFSGGPVTFSFLTPQKTVSLFAGYFIANPVSRPGTMTAYDANGNVVATDGPKSVLGGAAATAFSIVSASVNIAKVKVELAPFVYTVIDDLQFGGGAPITPPSGTPVVTISIPGTETLNYVDAPLRIVGNVTGQGLLPTVKVTLELLTPAPDGGFPFNNGLIPLADAGTNQIFDSAFTGSTAAFGKLLMGTYKLTVTATNLGGATGTASVTFTNLPSSVVATGSANSFGAFQYAMNQGACQMAKFANGGIAYFPAPAQNQVRPLPTAIAAKWFSVQDYSILRGDGRLGCPLGANDPILVKGPLGQLFSLDAQNFVRGRIYAPDEGTTTYTPNVFVDAIDRMSTIGDGSLLSLNDPLGAVEIGVPVADPTMNIGGEEPTLLFQRFRRPGYSGMPNTLEIRGRNPKLYVERVGGSVFDFTASTGNPQQVPAGKTLDAAPAVWESYDCQYVAATGQYVCPNVARPHVRAVTDKDVPLYTTESQIDNTGAYCPNGRNWQAAGGALGFQPISWSAVPLKTDLSDEPTIADTTDVMLKGWVTSSHRSGEDLKSTHAHMHCGLTAAGETVGITAVGCVLGSLLGPLGTAVGCTLGAVTGNQVASGSCWSDWVVHVRPIPLAQPDPNFGLLRLPQNVTPGPPYWNLLAATGDLAEQDDADMGDMETEIESDWQDGWVNLADNHRANPGNLVFLNGRWILDCAHPPFHSEIHEPNTHMVMETALPPAAMGGLVHNNPLDPNGSLVTRSQIWSNELYTGHPFNVTFWPPPRPSADAELSAMYLTYGGGGKVFNADGSISFFYVNIGTSGLLPDPNRSTATGNLASDGLTAAFIGPPGGHKIEGSGQVHFPTDDPDHSFGACGSFMANWYVGWTQQ